MKKTTREFTTAAEANAFLEGVEFVNDSAISARIDQDAPNVVQIADEDGCDDEGQDCQD